MPPDEMPPLVAFLGTERRVDVPRLQTPLVGHVGEMMEALFEMPACVQAAQEPAERDPHCQGNPLLHQTNRQGRCDVKHDRPSSPVRRPASDPWSLFCLIENVTLKLDE
jgi:hypothetical protein